MSQSRPAIEITGLRKAFGATLALSDIDLAITEKSIHGLIGGNGAGKSTILKILTGITRADSGGIRLFAQDYRPKHPFDALAKGVAIIPQELRVVSGLSVADNVVLGNWPGRPGWLGRVLPSVDTAAAAAIAARHLESLGLSIDPARRMVDLSFAERQSVVIARAVAREARVLIFDEPTAALADHETGLLFALIAKLKAAGITIIYVSHRLEEIVALCDRVTALRDGLVVADLERGAFGTPDLVALIAATRPHAPREAVLNQAPREAVLNQAPRKAGLNQAPRKAGLNQAPRKAGLNHAPREAVPNHAPREAVPRLPGRTVLEAGAAEGDDGPLRVAQRQIVGLHGLLGSGIGRLLRGLFGAEAGRTVTIDGTTTRLTSPRAAIAQGIGYVPSERFRAIVAALSVRDNILLPHLDRFSRAGRLDVRAMDAVVAPLMSALDIRPADAQARAGTLSGGNQQKVLFARWLVGTTRILCLDEPTHGVDVGAKIRIKQQIERFAQEGGAVLIHSVERDDLEDLADEVRTMTAGRLAAPVARGAAGFEGLS